MEDAVILANLFHDLPSASSENLVELFKDFQADRYPRAKAQMLMNRKVDRILSGQVKTPFYQLQQLIECAMLSV